MQGRQPRLEGRVAIVTGAGSSGPGVGTGKATSILFAREGAKVLLVDLVAAHAEETLATIRDEGGEASVFQADLTKAAQCEAMVDAAVGRYGAVHILVNNVGILGPGTVLTASEEEWDRVLEVCLKSMMLASKYALPKVIESGGGAIINISSVGALRGSLGRGALPYSAAKGGVISLTTSMAVSHGRDNVRVNCIVPGSIHTPMIADLTTPELREIRKHHGSLGTEGTGWDVGWAAVFLASDQARWITGVSLPVDAGALAMSPSPTPTPSG